MCQFNRCALTQFIRFMLALPSNAMKARDEVAYTVEAEYPESSVHPMNQVQMSNVSQGTALYHKMPVAVDAASCIDMNFN